MATGCVYEYLQEAHLEQYHPYFIRKELLQCDHLASIQMHDYASLGVVSMADRVRLFKLVNHIKSLHSAGKLCPHGYSQGAATHSETNFHEPQLPTIISQHDVERIPQIQHKPPQHNLDRKLTGAPVKQPKRETRYLGDSIEFRPGTDSPMFKCRKKLSFSDSDCEEAGDDGIALSTTSDAKFSHFESAEVSSGERKSARMITTQDVEPVYANMPTEETKEGEVYEEPNLLTSQPLISSVMNNLQSSAQTYLDRQDARNADANYQPNDANFHNSREERVRSRWDHIIFGTNADTNTVSHDLHSSGSASNVFGVQNNTEGSGDASNVNSTAAFSAATAAKFASQNVPSKLKDTQQPKQGKETISRNARGSLHVTQESPRGSSQVGGRMVKHSKNGIAMDIIEKGASRSKRGAFATTSKTTTNANAYFPKNLNKSTNAKATKVKTLVHMAGYDYGIPNSPSLHKSRQSVQESERIRVCIRKRPVNGKETQRQELDIIRINGDNAVIVEETKVAIDLSNFIQEHVFKFDEVFHSDCNNEEVYEHTAKALVSHLFKGKRSTCFAFGQTGSGKTFTLLGNSKVAGLYEHAGRDIYERLAGQANKTTYSLHISYFEIYCGHLHDLLNKRQRVQVRENARKKVCIAGLMETKITSPAHLKKVVEYGNHFRKIGVTGVNNSSSRSHAILQMELQSSTGRRYGRLSFIDLAGSERAADSVNSSRRTQIEGAGINQSLLALKECIRSLDQENGHTPYRQSKLTHILRDSFTGDSRTCMIANISPTQTACENTLNTLRYAHRVKDLYGNSCAAGSSGRTTKSPEANRTKEYSSENLGACAPQNSGVASAKPIPFHPSNIQLSSTPKKNEQEHKDVASENLPSRSVIQDTNESPIRGHYMKKKHNEDLSLTDVNFSNLNKSPKLTAEQKMESQAYSPLKYTSKLRSNMSPKFSIQSEHCEGQSNVRDSEVAGTQAYEQFLTSSKVSTRAADTQAVTENVMSSRDVLSMKSLDRAAEYLMEVSTKVRHGYETAFSSNSAGHAPPSYSSVMQDRTEESNATPDSNTNAPKVDLLQRHDHVLSNFDALLSQASAAVGGPKSADHLQPATSRTKLEHLEAGSSQQETSSKSYDDSFTNERDVLKSRSEPSLHTAESENNEQRLVTTAWSSVYAERNHSGVFCDKDPPIARPGRPQTQRSKSEEGRTEHAHKVYIATENLSILSKDFAEYEAKSFTRNNSSQEAATAFAEPQAKNATILHDVATGLLVQGPKSALPSPADFLQSLAQMKQLPKRTDDHTKGGPNEYHKNRETLSRLGQNFLTADSGGRLFQEMLGSPSNTRVSSAYNHRSDHSGITTVISRDIHANLSNNHTEGVTNFPEANSTAEQEGDSGLGASAGFKQISCDGEMSETDTMADVPSIHETKSSRSAQFDPSVKSMKQQTSFELPSTRAGSRLSGNLGSDGQTHPPFAGLQNHLLTAHEDQLSHITDLCKQEMNLLLKVRSGHLSFPTYVKCLQEILSSKADVLASLNSQLEMHMY